MAPDHARLKAPVNAPSTGREAVVGAGAHAPVAPLQRAASAGLFDSAPPALRLPRGPVQAAPGGDVIQRLVGFEFETAWGLTKGASEADLKRNETLITGNQWQMAPDYQAAQLGAEFKTTAIDDRSDPSVIEGVMTSLESFVGGLSAVAAPTKLPNVPLNGATVKAGREATQIHPNGSIWADPQMTSGVRLDRLIDLIKDLGSDRPAIKNELMGKGPGLVGPLGEVTAAAEGRVGNLNNKEYTGYVALLASLIKVSYAQGVAPAYAKALAPAFSRMDLGSLRIPAPRKLSDLFLKDVLVAAGLGEGAGSSKLFPLGVGKPPKAIPLTIKQWIDGIIAGKDLVPWNETLNQDNKPFGHEEVGEAWLEGFDFRYAGIPLELRGIKGGQPYKQWKPLAVNLFKYVKQLNSADQPAPYSTAAEKVEEQRKAAIASIMALFAK